VRAGEVMTRPVVAVRQDCPLAVAADLMARHGWAGLPVVGEDDRLVGIVGDGDVLVDRLDQRGSSRSTVAAVMTSEVLAASPDTELGELARRLVSGGRRLVPVVDGGRLVGIVTRGDLLRRLPQAGAPADRQVPGQEASSTRAPGR
jgi:CBS domain-containing protein